MEKYQLYRNALDAFQLICFSDLGFAYDDLEDLRRFARIILGRMEDLFTDQDD